MPGIDLRRAFRPVDDDGAFVDAIRELRDASGVYAIIDERTREVLYVGESHSRRLYGTLTRHFQRWGIDARSDRLGRSEGGTRYDRFGVLVAVVETADDRAQDVQEDEIARLDPADNSNGFPDDPPF